MKRFIFFLALAASLVASAQQDLGSFAGLRSQGPIPADLRKNLEQLYQEDKQRVREFNDGRLTNRDRVLRQSYVINRLTANGRILYGDPVTRMIESIADTLLTAYPDLRAQLRFYTHKSALVNAFTTGQGMIFVNLGLVAQCETEAQLAFVISHEIVHYYRQHNTEELARRKLNYKDPNDQLSQYLRSHHRSFEMEHEADSLGLALFYLPSPYLKQVADGVFDVLQFADLPFDELPFDTNYFNTPYYRLPSQYFTDKVGVISMDDNYDDSHDTHPNIRKRRARMAEMLMGQQGGSPFVTLSREEFLRLRDLARMECIRQQIINNEPVEAFYNSMVVLRDHPGNAFLQGAQAQALYNLARIKCDGGNMDRTSHHKGEIHQLYHLFNHLSPAEMCFIALHQAWTIHQAHPDDERVLELCRSLAGTIHDECHHVRPDFSATYDTLGSNPEAPSGKYAHIRRKNSSGSTNLPRYAFTDLLMTDPAFASFLDENLVARPHDTLVAQGNVLLFAPFYGVFDDKDDEMKYRRSDAQEEWLVRTMPQITSKLGVDLVDFSDPALRSHDDERFYNDFVTLVEWTNDFQSKRPVAHNRLFTQPLMDDFISRYGAHTLIISNVARCEYPGLTYADLTYTTNRVIDTRTAQSLAYRSKSYVFKDSYSLVGNEIYATLARAYGRKGPSGFFGHRFGVDLGLGVGFPIFNDAFDRHPQVNLDFRPELGLHYVVGETSTLNLSLDYNPTQFDCRREVSLVRADVLDLAFTYRGFVKAPAPLGYYVGVGLQGSRLALQPLTGTKPLRYLNPVYYRGGLQLETGRNRVIGKNLLVNFGARYTITLANMGRYESTDFLADPETLEMERAIDCRRMMNASLGIANSVVFHLNIGLMPF